MYRETYPQARTCRSEIAPAPKTRFSATSNTTEVTRTPPRHHGIWSSLRRGSGLAAAHHVPGALQIEGTSLRPPHTLRAGNLGGRLRLGPRLKKKEGLETKGELARSSGVFPDCAAPLFPAGGAGRGAGGGAFLRPAPEHRELGPEQLPVAPTTIERGPRAPPAGGGRSGDGSGRESVEGRARPKPDYHRESERVIGPAGGARAGQRRYSQAGEEKLPPWLHFR